MAFIKKIIILNEVAKGYGKSELRGLATVEKNGGKAVCRLTIFNLSEIKAGKYAFGVKSQNLRLQKFELTQTSQNFSLDPDTDLEGVISCILAYRQPDKAVPLLWGSTDGKKIFEGNMTDGFMDASRISGSGEFAGQTGTGGFAQKHNAEAYGERNEDEPAQKKLQEKEPQTAKAAGVETAAAGYGYRDDAVAAENYYAADYGRKNNDAIVMSAGESGFYGEKESAEAYKTEYSADYINRDDAGGDAAYIYKDKDTEQKHKEPEKSGAPESRFKGGKFYSSIKSQLDELFDSYPKEEYLCSLLRGTDWVKVDYDENGQYYTVGVIVEEETVKYICYGVPGKFAKTPPQELKGFCQWLPFDLEKPETEGYWMMYQDAENGKSVTLEMI